MANEILQKTGTQIAFSDSTGDFSPAAANDLRQGTPTDVAIELASVADDAARQSSKADLGATRAAQYTVMAAIEMASTSTGAAGETIEFWWAPSPDSVAANSNPGGVGGTDAAYTGYASNLDDSLRQLDLIGVVPMTTDLTSSVQIATVGTFSPAERYGALIVVNRAGGGLHSDDVEMHVVFTPIIDEVQ